MMKWKPIDPSSRYTKFLFCSFQKCFSCSTEKDGAKQVMLPFCVLLVLCYCSMSLSTRLQVECVIWGFVPSLAHSLLWAWKQWKWPFLMGQQNVWGEGSVAVDQIRPARTRTTVASTLASSAGSSFSKVFSRCFSRGNYLPCVPPSLQTIFKPPLM